MDTLILAAQATPALGFIGWIIIGGLAGWIGSKVMGTDQQMGVVANIVVGVIGGFIGGWVLTLFNVDSGGYFWSFLTCLLGAIILLGILKAILPKR